MCVGPFFGAGDVFNRCVEPHVKDFALHARPVLRTAFHWHTPAEVARDATVLQAITIVQPFLRDRGGEHRPIVFAFDPLRQLIFHLALAQIEMLGLAHFQIG